MKIVPTPSKVNATSDLAHVLINYLWPSIKNLNVVITMTNKYRELKQMIELFL